MTNNTNPPVSLDAFAVGRSSTNAFLTVFMDRDPTTNDVNYPIQKRWVNTSTANEWILTGFSTISEQTTANWLEINMGGVATEQFLPDSGTNPVVPNVLGQVGVHGIYTTTIVGGTNEFTVTPTSGGYPITPFVVGPIGQAGYQTIQTAINAANAAGGGMVWIQEGTYTENLTFFSGIQISGPSEQSVTIIGTHIPPDSGTLNIDRMTFVSATNVFSSASAGTTAIIMEDCSVIVTNGYTFNLPNWTSSGSVAVFNIGNFGTNDGFFKNTGGCQFYAFAAGIGNGTTNPMEISGTAIFANQIIIGCPVTLVTGADLLSYGCAFTQTITCSNNSIWSSVGDSFTTGVNSAITYSSSGNSSISNASINSSHNPAIGGTGVGTLTLADVSFTSNSAIANTLTLGNTGGWYPPGNISSVGTVLSSNGTGVVPTFQTLSSLGAFTSINNQVFTTTGTYTPTSGMKYCSIQCLGGGGGGGGAATTSGSQIAIGDGGGAGEYAVGIFSAATIGSSQSVTIGNGGTGGSSGGGAGGNGGTTHVGSLISSNGGMGGNFGTAEVAASGIGGAGGTGGSGGDYRCSGSGGGAALGAASPLFTASGAGASSFLGGGAQAQPTTGAGNAGLGYGSGGGGACNITSAGSALGGGAGIAGVVIITEYI